MHCFTLTILESTIWETVNFLKIAFFFLHKLVGWVENNTFRLTECSRQLSGGADMENGGTEENRPRLARRDKTRHHTDKQRQGQEEREI